MKKSLFIMALGAFALTSCSQDEVLDVQKDAVQFSVVADKASRGAVTTTANIGDFMVNAFVAGNPSGNLNQFFMKDVKVSGSNATGWSYDFTRFWPTTDKINFYSYSPASLTGVSIASDVQTITHIVSTTCADQIDVLYALNNGLGKADGEVKVNFRHALAQIVFQAENSKSDLEVVIDGVRIVNVKNSGTFSWPTASTNNPNYTEIENGGNGDTPSDTQLDGSWGTWALSPTDPYVSHPADITQQILTGETAAAVALTKAADPLLVMPQTFIPATVEDKFMKIEAGKTFFAISCKIYSIENGTTKTLLWPSTDGFAEVVIPATSPDKIDAKDAWKQGRKYVYTFKFGEGAGYIGEGGVTPGTPDDPDAPSTDKPANDPSNPNQSGDPVLVPVTFTVTVDQFQTVQQDTDMNTGNTVSDAVQP